MELRDARRLLRRIHAAQEAADQAGFGRPQVATVVPPQAESGIAQFDRLVTHPGVVAASRRLYRDGHFAQAVLQAYVYVNNLAKSKSGRTADGEDLMRSVFSPGAPVLRLNRGRSRSEKDEQRGYMDLFAGCMEGIRNPRAHEHDWPDDADGALVLLVWADHLARRVDAATRTRSRRRRSRATTAAPASGSPTT